jgi:hypothetical protein
MIVLIEIIIIYINHKDKIIKYKRIKSLRYFIFIIIIIL